MKLLEFSTGESGVVKGHEGHLGLSFKGALMDSSSDINFSLKVLSFHPLIIIILSYEYLSLFT